MNRTFVVMLLAAGLVVSVGCKKASEKMTEKLVERAIEHEGGGKADVDIQDGKVTVKSKDGEFEMASGDVAKLPADFPSDVYVLKDAKVIMTMKTRDGIQVVWETKEAPAKAATQYAGEMKASGWEEETNVNMGDSLMSAYKKGDRQTTVVVTKTDTGSNVQVVVGKE